MNFNWLFFVHKISEKAAHAISLISMDKLGFELELDSLQL